jgi:CheY-like chemotaxis protein
MYRILIVDDERVIADTLAVIFEQRGYESRAAYSAERALEVIATWPPDLAIVDVVLPKMNGIDLAILLKAEYPTCQIRLFSGQAATSDLLAGATASGNVFEVLAKPVHLSIPLFCLTSPRNSVCPLRIRDPKGCHLPTVQAGCQSPGHSAIP